MRSIGELLESIRWSDLGVICLFGGGIIIILLIGKSLKSSGGRYVSRSSTPFRPAESSHACPHCGGDHVPTYTDCYSGGSSVNLFPSCCPLSSTYPESDPGMDLSHVSDESNRYDN